MTTEKSPPVFVELTLTPRGNPVSGKAVTSQKERAPLPGFNFAVPMQDRSENAQSIFVKGMIQLVAAAMVAMAEGKDLQFVALLRFDLDSEVYQFDFYCPFKKIVETLREQKSNRGAILKNLEGLEIRYQIQLPSGWQLPVVFVYQTKQRHLLVTNQNQLSEPRQFLDPEQCRTTSGLLNMIGSVAYLNKVEDKHDHIASLVGKANVAMNRNLDEWLRWVYCLVDLREVFNRDRILVEPNNGESYSFSYPD